MNNDLVKLHQNLTGKETTEEIKSKIEKELYGQMRKHFFELLTIGEVLGYDKLQDEMKKSIELLEQMKNR